MTELNKILERIEKAIANFNGSFMSDTKWRKFFNALIEQEICLKEFNLKYVAIEDLGNGIWKVFYRNVLLGYFNEKQLRKKEQSTRLETNLV